MLRDKFSYKHTPPHGIARLLGGLLEVGDEVVPVLVLLQAAESHLGAGDVLLGVLEVGEL